MTTPALPSGVAAAPRPIEPALGLDDAIAGQAAPDAGLTLRFNQQMATPPASPGGTDPAAGVARTGDAADAPARSNLMLGDSILQGLNTMGSDIQHSWQFVNEALANNQTPSVSDMLKIQVAMIGASMNHELVSKCVSRATQNLDQLVKLQ